MRIGKAERGSIARGMEQAQSYLDGEREGFTVHRRQTRDSYAKAVRAKTKLTQEAFARTYRLEVSALRDWEQGRRAPDKAAVTLLTAIERDPETLARILA